MIDFDMQILTRPGIGTVDLDGSKLAGVIVFYSYARHVIIWQLAYRQRYCGTVGILGMGKKRLDQFSI